MLATFYSPGDQAGLTNKLKSLIISHFVFDLFRPLGEVLLGVCSSASIIIIS